MVALQATGQAYVIDTICPGTVRVYRVDGEKDSEYVWMIDNKPILNPEVKPFTKVDPITGLEMSGSEITYQWEKLGSFTLSVSQRLYDHCDTLTHGVVEVIDPQKVFAKWICSTSQIILEAPLSIYSDAVLWTTTGDGTFADPTALSTIYNIGIQDEITGKADLLLHAKVPDHFSGCLEEIQPIKVVVPFDNHPNLHNVRNDHPYQTVDLAEATIGNDPDLIFNYYYDRNATLGIKDYTQISKAGTYYIKATSTSSGCSVIDSVKVIITKDKNCKLFIPNAFSPNPEKDDVHTYFQIYCIEKYPNAKLYIFDQLGNKLFEKEKYGNEDRWGIEGDAWWDGKPDRGRGRGERVAPGTYFYVLDLGNGEVKKSFVFVSY